MFGLLVCVCSLCGMWFDLFGCIVECKMECVLVDDYEIMFMCVFVVMIFGNVV